MRLDFVAPFILDKLKRELPSILTYHNVYHTEDVYESAKSIALAEKIEGEELDILLTAALFHDSGFLIALADHESSSCRLAREYLPDFGYQPSEVEQVCELIMATRVPQHPKSHLQEIICDADLDYLGRADFHEKSRALFEEMKQLGTIADEPHYMQLQLAFLKNHHYFTHTAKNRREAKKAEHVREVEKYQVNKIN